jgi:hypothetical protein
MAVVELLGVYPIEVSDALVAQAMAAGPGNGPGSDGERSEAEWQVRRELASVVLVEALVRDHDRAFTLIDFGQSDGDTLLAGDPVAYDEQLLSDDGRRLRGSLLTKNTADTLRFAFFLHQYDPNKSILTSYGPVTPPEPTPIPPRLARLMVYQPPDRRPI